MKKPKRRRAGISKRLKDEFRKSIIRGTMSNKSKIGYVKLYRTSEDNELYFSEPFTKWQAWQDLILLTSHKDTFFFARGVEIQLQKGQIGWSVKSLAKRWCWSYTKVNSFLEFLKKRGQIDYQKNNVTTVITLINWDKYQGDEKAEVNQKETKSKPKVNQKETYKNVKNDNNVKNDVDVVYPASPSSPFFVIHDAVKALDFSNDSFALHATRDTGKSIPVLEKLRDKFLEEQKALSKLTWPNENDLKKHFVNWCKKQQTPNGVYVAPKRTVIDHTKTAQNASR